MILSGQPGIGEVDSGLNLQSLLIISLRTAKFKLQNGELQHQTYLTKARPLPLYHAQLIVQKVERVPVALKI